MRALMGALFFAASLIYWVFFSSGARFETRGSADCPAASSGPCNCDGYDYMSPNHPWKRNKKGFILKDGSDNLLWFVQISDIHISQFLDPLRVDDLREFCAGTIKAIKPPVVVASGDLTDAKTRDFVGSRQYLKEWQDYASAVSNATADGVVWLDIRGNHDDFNVVDVEEPENYFRRYSVQGRKNPRSYTFTISRGGDNYTFVALDGTPNPGLKKPFNFVGMLLESDWEIAQKLERDASCSSYAIWFAHYPTSVFMSPSPGLRWLVRRSLVFLSGHLHTLGGLVPTMHTIHRPHGNLELELGDWRSGRFFRVLAIDHGLLSHVDVKFGQWPIVLVTNPKDARYMLPMHEPLEIMQNSSHVRALIFSPSPIRMAQFRLNKGEWMDMKRHDKNQNLFLGKWDPKLFTNGLHEVDVFAEDEQGRVMKVKRSFALDNTRLSVPSWLGGTILSGSLPMTSQALFGIALSVALIPICAARVMHQLALSGKISPRSLFRRRVWCWRRLWLLSSIDAIFFPLVLFPLYLTIGPWFIGDVIDGHLGATFLWGTIVAGRYIPPDALTFIFAFLQMILYQLPLTFALADIVRMRYDHVVAGKSPTVKACLRRNLPMVIFVILMSALAFVFAVGYGKMAFVLGPFRTWSVVMAAVLWWYALRLPKNAFSSVERLRMMVESSRAN